ncbi:MAG: NADP-dependent isocitrate dehydrogenase [Betaproteobacteria bacterium]|nr:NADP-dependent isocitrate dehydrogenase [Betaproteobacteria bacterium]
MPGNDFRAAGDLDLIDVTSHQHILVPAADLATSSSICVARGDGIGPEIMGAVLDVLSRAGAHLDIREGEIGSRAVNQGFASGISPLAWRILKERKVLLKAPTGGRAETQLRDPNATIRKSLGLFASVRSSEAYHPYISSPHPDMRITIIRENEEDLYAGIEHRHTHDVAQCLKLISRSGSERVIRYAFEYARLNGRRKVTCFTKDSVMRLTDGMFRQVFETVATEYPKIESQHFLVDTGIARFVSCPEAFDVVVLPNVYGDILSDVAAELSSSLAVSPVANMGYHGAMFEASHGCGHDLAGRDLANPSALLRAAVMMLNYVGQGEVASRIHNAWLRTLEDGLHTADVAPQHPKAKRLGTQQFAQAVVSRLGSAPRVLTSRTPRLPKPDEPSAATFRATPREQKHLIGVDVFLHWRGSRPDVLARRLRAVSLGALTLTLISNRGLAVWPRGMHQTVFTDHWRCRFKSLDGQLTHRHVAELLQDLATAHFDFVKTENLYDFDEIAGYSHGHGI